MAAPAIDAVAISPPFSMALATCEPVKKIAAKKSEKDLTKDVNE
jgi:hypothetical protein